MQERKKYLSLFTRDADIIRMVLVTLFIFCAMAAIRPVQFLRINNFTSMGYQIPELGFYSIAMMMVMITGGRDLSIVGIGNLACIIAALIMHDGAEQGLTGAAMYANIGFGVVAALVVGILCGLLNGVIVAYTGIAPMLVTMATSYIFTGVGIVVTRGEAVSRVYPEFVSLGNTAVQGFPIPLIILMIVLIFTAVLLNKTKYGFELKMVGSNALASHYTGINNKSVLIKTYLYSGILCAICGLEILARTDTAKADYAFTYTFQAILCSVLGATNPLGGFAKVSCLTLSLLSLQLLSSGFNMLRLGGFFKEFAWGLLLLIVLSINYLMMYYRYKRSLIVTTRRAKETNRQLR